MEKIIEGYIFSSVTKEKIESFKHNIFISIIIFILSLFSHTEAYSILYSLDIISFINFFITNVVGIIFILFFFTIWVIFVSVLFKKSISVNKYFSGLLTMFSIYLLLLPISFISLYFDLKLLYFLTEVMFSLIVLNRILKYTKEFCGFNQKEMFFVVGVPIVFISLLFLLPIIYIFLFIYGKI
jgi:hypothetical protein